MKSKYKRVTESEIEQAIRNFWPEEKVKAFLNGEHIKLKKITDFAEEHKRLYRSTQSGKRRKQGGFRTYFEKVYPGWYEFISRKSDASLIDIPELKKTLREKEELGQPFSQSSLRYSARLEDRILWRKVRTLSRNPPKGLKRGGYNEIVRQLTGRRLFTLKGPRKQIALISEELVHFLLRWALLLNLRFPEFEQGQIYRSGRERIFLYNKRRCEADCRAKDQAVEVKSGLGRLGKKELDELVNRYTPQKNYWVTGEPIQKSTVVLHARKDLHLPNSKRLKEARIRVVDYDRFTEYLREVVQKIKKKYLPEVAKVTPRTNRLEYLLELNEEVALYPTLLLSTLNTARRQWSKHLLLGLIKKAKELYNGS